MIEHRRFRVVLVDQEHGIGLNETASANTEVDYEGRKVQVIVK